MRLSYRYRGEADLSIFNTPRAKIDSQSTMDLLVRYTPNSDDWYAGVFVKNLRDQQHINALRENSNVGGGFVKQSIFASKVLIDTMTDRGGFFN